MHVEGIQKMSVWKNELSCIIHLWIFPWNCACDSQRLREVTSVWLSSLLLYIPKSLHKPSIPYSQFRLPIQPCLPRIPINQSYQAAAAFPKPWDTFNFHGLSVWHVLPPYLSSKLLLILQSPNQVSSEFYRLSHLTKIELIAPTFSFHQHLKPWQVHSRYSVTNYWNYLLSVLCPGYSRSERQIHRWATQALVSVLLKWRSFGEEIGCE